MGNHQSNKLRTLLGAAMLAGGAAFVPAVAADLFNGKDFSGWELQTTPAAPLASVFTMLPDGVVASTGQPSGFLATTASYRNCTWSGAGAENLATAAYCCTSAPDPWTGCGR